MKKSEITSIAAKNRVTGNIIKAIGEGSRFLLLGHRDPDADCLASLVAFALLLSKLQKDVTLFLPGKAIEQLNYLLAICRYNDITVERNADAVFTEPFTTAVILDTPKADMLMKNAAVQAVLDDPAVLKIELDHHLEADAVYSGDEGYCLVSQASSTCELIGYLAIKLAGVLCRKGETDTEAFFTRNIALAILTGIVGDSQMGRYLKNNRERWYYRTFSEIFHRYLIEKTHKGSRNMSSMEDIFAVIQSLSEQEEHCYAEFTRKKLVTPSIIAAVHGPEASERLFAAFGREVIVNVSKSAADHFSEQSGRLGLVGYYDDPDLSDLIQFRFRRSAAFTSADLRDIIRVCGIENGGGHPGAVGFRVKKSEVNDVEKFTKDFMEKVERMI